MSSSQHFRLLCVPEAFLILNIKLFKTLSYKVSFIFGILQMMWTFAYIVILSFYFFFSYDVHVSLNFGGG